MFKRVFRLGSTLADYTIGTAIVLTHLLLVGQARPKKAPHSPAPKQPFPTMPAGLVQPRPARPAEVSRFSV